MRISQDLADMYDVYYSSHMLVERKRQLASIDSVGHMVELMGTDFGDLVDVGAGNGAVLQQIWERSLAKTVSALEVSSTGIEKIRARTNLPIRYLTKYDGYKMPFEDNQFDTAISVHVIEHIEHERLFLQEIGRISRRVFIEVPLEGGFRGRINRSFGHINYYSPMTFINLIETSGLRIVDYRVTTSSLDYEIHCYGRFKGTAKNLIRRGVLGVLGKDLAPHLMNFLLSVVVEKVD